MRKLEEKEAIFSYVEKNGNFEYLPRMMFPQTPTALGTKPKPNQNKIFKAFDGHRNAGSSSSLREREKKN